MAQASISGFFPAKKRREGNHASIKKRKLTETTQLAIPVVNSTSDADSVPITLPTKITKPRAPTKPTARTRRRKQPERKAPVKSKSQKSLQDLFDIISEAASDGDTTEQPKDTQSSQDTMTKLASLTASPVKPTTSPKKPLSRAATIVRLAQQKSPAKPSTAPPIEKAKPLSQLKPTEPVVKDDSSSSAPVRRSRRKVLQSREEIATELHRLSAKELATPTPHERTREPVMKEFRCLEIESPKKDQSKIPAYKRFQSLAEPREATPTRSHDLPLPKSYQLLGEKFRCTDTVVSMLQKRRELPTFSKLKKAVQEMCRRDFEQRNLAQIKTVYPEAFVFRQEKNIPGSLSNKHQLTVECSEGALPPAQLIKRRKHFQQELVSIVMEHHKKFLSELSPPLSIPQHQVLRWHPEFILEAVPAVAEAALPQPPIKESCCGAADLLKACESRLAPRVVNALTNSAAQASPSQPSVEPAESKQDPSLKGVSQALLDKIRAKEAAKAKAAITRDPLREKQLEMLGRMPEFVRIIRCLFVGEKKAAILWDDVISKLCDSTASRLSPERVGEHLQYLSQLASYWISLITIKKRKYVKVDRKTDIKRLLETIEQSESKLKL